MTFYRAAGIVWVVGALTAGCASSSYDQLGHDVGQLVKSGAGVTPQWRLKTDDSLRKAVSARLAAGVDADAAVEIALLASPDLQASFERLGLARADYLEAATLSDPVVSWSRQSLRGGPGSKLEWSVLQSISDLFSLPVRRRAADQELNSARLTAANEIMAGIAAVRSAWLEALAAEKSAGLAAERGDLARLEAELMERFVKAGNEPDTELQAQRLAYAEQQRATAAAETARLQARVRLERLMGVSDLQLAWELRGEFAALPETDGELADLETAALRNRLDMQAARKRVEARLAFLSSARQKRLVPEFAAGYGREREPDGTRLAGPQFELQLPIFSAAQVALARSDAEARLAMREAEAAALDVRGDVRLARAQLAVARAALLLARDTSVPAAEIQADLRQREFFYMIIGPFAAMQARGAVMEAKLQQLQAERDYWLARIALSRAAALPLQAIREWAEPAAAGEAGGP